MTYKKLGHLCIIFITLVNTFLIHPEIAWACAFCMYGDSASAEFAASDAVFTGTVTGIIRPSQIPYSSKLIRSYYALVPPLPYLNLHKFHDQTVIFEVEEGWKGATTTYLTVYTGGGHGDCGYWFSQGQQYLVYSKGGKGNLYTSICSRTTEIAEAAEDLNYLRTLPKNELTPVIAPQTFCLISVTAVVILLLSVIWGIRRKLRNSASPS